ncbi:MAG: O-antigen ligase family protein [Phycisphaeraceae bacterium]
MKHFLVLLALTMLSGVAAIAVPFWGVMLYYGFATLRPQHLWEWSLLNAPHIRWSLTAICIAFVATIINLPTLLQTFRPNRVLILLGVYAVLMLMSMLTAFSPDISWYWAQEYAKVFVMFLIATLVIQRFWQVRAMAVMIALCLGYLAYNVNFMYFFEGGRLDIFHHGYGGLDNNGAGSLLALGLPFAYFLATSPVGRWSTGRRIFGALLAMGIIHAVMMTYSRGAMLAAAVGLVWLMVHHRPRVQGVAMSVVLVAAISVMAGAEIRDRAVSTADFETDASALSRFDSWAAAWDIVTEHPLLGKGIRNSNDYSQNYGADLAGRTIHNQYLQIAADSGIPAACVYIAMVGFAFFGLMWARRRCIRAEDVALHKPPDPEAPHDQQDLIDRARDAGALCLAVQAGVAMFAFSGLFLSVELVEVPWLLLALAGILPAAVDRRLRGLGLTDESDADNDDGDDVFTPTPPTIVKPARHAIPERRAA